jgi:glycerol-3-phosphate cytidylyltransferase-like family protein
MHDLLFIHQDHDTAASYKRRPIMTLAERVAVIESCRYVDEVIADAPLRVTEEFLTEHGITTVVHGDDLSHEGAKFVIRSGCSSREPRLHSAHRRHLNHPADPAGARRGHLAK